MQGETTSSLQPNKQKAEYIENLTLFRSFSEGNLPPNADPKTTQRSKRKEFQPSTVISIGTNDKLEDPNLSERPKEFSEDKSLSLNTRGEITRIHTKNKLLLQELH